MNENPCHDRFCGRTGKQCFQSAKRAKETAKNIGRKRERNQKPLVAYLCEFCHFFHLSSHGEDIRPNAKRPQVDAAREQLREYREGEALV